MYDDNYFFLLKINRIAQNKYFFCHKTFVIKIIHNLLNKNKNKA